MNAIEEAKLSASEKIRKDANDKVKAIIDDGVKAYREANKGREVSDLKAFNYALSLLGMNKEAIAQFLADAEKADRGGVGVFDGTVMREDEHAFTERVQDRLHEIALALKATRENREVLRIQVVDTAQHAIQGTEASAGHVRKRAPQRGER